VLSEWKRHTFYHSVVHSRDYDTAVGMASIFPDDIGAVLLKPDCLIPLINSTNVMHLISLLNITSA